MKSVLLIDDDKELTGLLQEYLTEEGYDVVVGHDGRSAITAAQENTADIIILDIMMPQMSGIEVLQRIRRTSQVPVLMLTARGDDIDRISGLNLGADDYVTKPCSPGELSARIRAIHRRVSPRAITASNQLKAGHLVIHHGNRTAEWYGQALALTGTEFCLLEVLARNAGQIVSKQDISKQVFGKPLTPFDRRIDVHISSVRQKLGHRDDKQPWIRTIRGHGYQLLQD